MGSRPIHVVANGKMPFFLIGGKYSIVQKVLHTKKEKELAKLKKQCTEWEENFVKCMYQIRG